MLPFYLQRILLLQLQLQDGSLLSPLLASELLPLSVALLLFLFHLLFWISLSSLFFVSLSHQILVPSDESHEVLPRADLGYSELEGEVGLAGDGEELGAVDAVVDEGGEERREVLALVEEEGQEVVRLPADALLWLVLKVTIQ